MKLDYIKFVNKLIPEKNREDDDLYYQSVLLVSAFFFSVFFLLTFSLLHFIAKNYVEVVSLMTVVAVFIFSIIFYPKSGNNVIFGNLIIGAAFIAFFIIAFTSGGIYSSIMPWFTAVSLTGFLFSGRKSGIFWTATSLLTIITFYVLDLFDVKIGYSFDLKQLKLVYGTSIFSSSAYVVLIVISYEILNTLKTKKIKLYLQENKEKQEELRQQQEEISAQRDMLEESEQRIRHILEILPDPVLMIDQNGFVNFWNTAMENMTEVKKSEMIGKGNYSYALPFYGSQRPILIDLVQIDDKYLEENYASVQKIGNILQAETYVPSVNGKELYLVGRATAIYDSKEIYLGAVEVIHDITERRKSHEKIERQNKDIENSIKYAKRIQQALFSETFILSKILNDYFIFFQPREIVSGDFYWIAERDNKLFIAAVDCTGHGVPGAFMSLLGISYLNNILLERNITEPHEVLDSLREMIISNLHQDVTQNRESMDMALCCIDYKDKKLEFAGAHNPLILIRNNEIYEYKANKMPVGYDFREKTAKFSKHSVDILKDDKFYIYTDGFKDQFNEQKRKVYSKNFKNLILDISNYNFEKQKEHLRTFLKAWQNNCPQTDDILVIGFKL